MNSRIITFYAFVQRKKREQPNKRKHPISQCLKKVREIGIKSWLGSLGQDPSSHPITSLVDVIMQDQLRLEIVYLLVCVHLSFDPYYCVLLQAFHADMS